jgi:hypothetical protein
VAVANSSASRSLVESRLATRRRRQEARHDLPRRHEALLTEIDRSDRQSSSARSLVISRGRDLPGVTKPFHVVAILSASRNLSFETAWRRARCDLSVAKPCPATLYSLCRDLLLLGVARSLRRREASSSRDLDPGIAKPWLRSHVGLIAISRRREAIYLMVRRSKSRELEASRSLVAVSRS